MDAAMDLIRRMPPTEVDTALASLIALLPQHSSDLLSKVDHHLQEAFDEECGKSYLLCDYNRDRDSHRSPWSNKYRPPLDDGTVLPSDLRRMEVEANEVFASYRDQYYEGGSSSVYIWETDEAGSFAACFLVKKDGSRKGHGHRGLLQHGLWDAIHVVEVTEAQDEGKAHYRVTSTVMLSMTTKEDPTVSFNLSGSIVRQTEADQAVREGHICNMGRMIEEMENKLRNTLAQVYFGKAKELVCRIREPLVTLAPTCATGQGIQQAVVSDIIRKQLYKFRQEA